MSEGLKCTLCKQKFKLLDGARDHSPFNEAPLLLKCGHTYCHKCLVRAYDRKKGILCPSCKMPTHCPMQKNQLQGLIPNITILGNLLLKDVSLYSLDKVSSLTGVLQKKKILKNDPKKQTCSECMCQVAALSCVQCGVTMCNKCFDFIHKNSRVLQRHQSVPLTEGSCDLSSLDCSVHHAMIEYYCTEDEKLICRDCLVTDHSSHTVLSLQEQACVMSPEIHEALKKASPFVTALKAHIHSVEAEIKAVEYEAKVKCNKILELFVEVSGKVQSNLLSSISMLEGMSCHHIRQLLALRDAALSRLQTLEAQCSDANLIINPPPDEKAFVVNPFKTLEQLILATDCPCLLEKSFEKVDDEYDSSEESDERFYLNVNNEIVAHAQQWLSVQSLNTVRYSVRKPVKLSQSDDDETRDSEESDAESSKSNDLPAEQNAPSSREKLRLIRVPPARNQEHVYITMVTSPHNFYIQRNSDKEQIKQIQNSLQTFSRQRALKDDTVTCIRAGELCVALSPGRQWCRVKVTKVLKRRERYDSGNDGFLDEFTACSKDDVEVSYIDFGRLSKIKVSCLRQLPQSLRRIPPLAFLCSLAGVVPYSGEEKWSQEAIGVFAKMVANRPILMTTVSRDSGQRFVDLHKPAPDEIDNDVPVSVRDALLFLKLAKYGGTDLLQYDAPSDQLRHRDYFKPTTLPSRSFVSVALSHFHSISKFFVQQLDSNAAYLEGMTEKIQKFVAAKRKAGFDASSPFSILRPRVGMPCLALYDCCEMWYRAKVTEVYDDKQEVNVFYVDYGNEARVSVHQTLKIPDIYMKLPYQGIECCLTNITPPDGGEEWPEESLGRFFELVGEDRQLRMYIKSLEGGVYHVELFDWTDDERSVDNTLSVNERLVHEGLAGGLTAHKVVAAPEVNKLLQPGYGSDLVNSAASKNKKKRKKRDGTLPSPSVSEEPEASSSCTTNDGAVDDANVSVVYTESPSSFFVQTKKQWRLSNSLTRDLHKHVTDQEAQTANKQWVVDDLCTFFSTFEKRWCRAKIVTLPKMEQSQKEEERSCTVRVVDFGLTETAALHSLLPLPREFAKNDAYVTWCSLSGVEPAGSAKWTNNAIDAFKELVADKRCKLVEIGADADGALPIKLYIPGDEEEDVGRKLVLKGVALPMIKPGSSGSKSSAANPPSLTRIQPHGDAAEPPRKPNRNGSQTSELVEHASEPPPQEGGGLSFKTPPRKSVERSGPLFDSSPTDVMFSPKTSTTQFSYRSLDEESFSSSNVAPPVFPNAIKFGNPPSEEPQCNEEDPPSPPRMMRKPNSVSKAASGASTADDGEASSSNNLTDPPDDNSELNDSFDDSPVDATDVQSPAETVILEKAHKSPSKEDVRTIPDSERLKKGEEMQCVVSHIEQYNVLYLKKLPIEDVLGSLKDSAMSAPPLEDCSINTPCLACFDRDSDWHRAEIVGHDAAANVVYARYVDYGLVESIDDMERLRVLPEELLDTPSQAIACCLASMPTPEQLGMDEGDMMTLLASLIGRSRFECAVEDGQSSVTGLPLVHLYTDGRSALVVDEFQKVLTRALMTQCPDA